MKIMYPACALTRANEYSAIPWASHFALSHQVKICPVRVPCPATMNVAMENMAAYHEQLGIEQTLASVCALTDSSMGLRPTRATTELLKAVRCALQSTCTAWST
eukprot:6203435-Amphidinium_carterae.1